MLVRLYLLQKAGGSPGAGKDLRRYAQNNVQFDHNSPVTEITKVVLIQTADGRILHSLCVFLKFISTRIN